MKRLAYLLLILIILISGCSSSGIDNEIDFSTEEVVFEGESLATYAHLRFNRGYDCGFSFYNVGDSKYPYEHVFYIWDNNLGNELSDTINKIIDKLDDIENNYYQFHLEFADEFVLKRGVTEVIKLAKSRSTAIMALLLPKDFIINSKDFKDELMEIFLALTNDSNSSWFETVALKVRKMPELKLCYNNQHYQKNEIYGFETLAEIDSFISNTYIEKAEYVNTGGNHLLTLDNAYAGKLNQGQYLWFQFTAPADGYYSFNTEGSEINSVLQVYSQFNGDVVLESETDINEKAEITIYLNQNQVIYFKLFAAKLEEFGEVRLLVTFVQQ